MQSTHGVRKHIPNTLGISCKLVYSIAVYVYTLAGSLDYEAHTTWVICWVIGL